MRILIWGEVKNGGPYDVFRRINYSNIYEELLEEYNANMMNIGNKVWIQGIVSCLSTPENELFFYDPNETWEVINEKYDRIVYSAANMFSPQYKDLIKEVAELFRSSKIPVYVVAVGVQAKSYDDLEKLTQSIREETKEFLDTIYGTGGEIACRGFFTKAFFDRVDSNTTIVTGCPSLFQNGRQLKIVKQNTENLKPIFNGHLLQKPDIFKSFPQSVFIDQDSWIQETYNKSFYEQSNIKCLLDLFKRHGYVNLELFLSKRIKIFYDIPDWKRYIEKERFNYSIGTRIHGNILSLLCGIPATVLACDSRTMEMADFYDIPYRKYNPEEINIQECYDDCNFDKFNETFSEKFDLFEQFLINCKLVKKVNQNNIFWGKEQPIQAKEIDKRIAEMEKLLRYLGPCTCNLIRVLSRIDRRNNPLLYNCVPLETYKK